MSRAEARGGNDRLPPGYGLRLWRFYLGVTLAAGGTQPLWIVGTSVYLGSLLLSMLVFLLPTPGAAEIQATMGVVLLALAAGLLAVVIGRQEQLRGDLGGLCRLLPLTEATWQRARITTDLALALLPGTAAAVVAGLVSHTPWLWALLLLCHLWAAVVGVSAGTGGRDRGSGWGAAVAAVGVLAAAMLSLVGNRLDGDPGFGAAAATLAVLSSAGLCRLWRRNRRTGAEPARPGEYCERRRQPAADGDSSGAQDHLMALFPVPGGRPRTLLGLLLRDNRLLLPSIGVALIPTSLGLLVSWGAPANLSWLVGFLCGGAVATTFSGAKLELLLTRPVSPSRVLALPFLLGALLALGLPAAPLLRLDAADDARLRKEICDEVRRRAPGADDHDPWQEHYSGILKRRFSLSQLPDGALERCEGGRLPFVPTSTLVTAVRQAVRHQIATGALLSLFFYLIMVSLHLGSPDLAEVRRRQRHGSSPRSRRWRHRRLPIGIDGSLMAVAVFAYMVLWATPFAWVPQTWAIRIGAALALLVGLLAWRKISRAEVV